MTRAGYGLVRLPITKWVTSTSRKASNQQALIDPTSGLTERIDSRPHSRVEEWTRLGDEPR